MSTLTQFLDDHQIRWREGGTHQHVRPGWIGLPCPWCHSESWHLGVRIIDGYTCCWRCGTHRLGETLRELTSLPWNEIKEAATDFQRTFTQQIKERGAEVKIPKGVCGLMPPHLDYIKRRGFDPEYLENTWGVKGIGPMNRLAWRLFIPIMLQNHMVSWTTRAITDKTIRYISASPSEEKISLKSILYGQDLAPGHVVIVCEGPADAWAIGPGAVATMGLNVSKAQIDQILAYPMRVICLDNSPDAQSVAKKLGDHLLADEEGETVVVRLESGKDPGSADPEEIAALRERFHLPAQNYYRGVS